MPQPLSAWIEAARPRTLPLALSSIGMGSFLAASVHRFHWQVCVLCCLTTIFLQILSNLANDYGDSIHGADSAEREGPKRAVQSGVISSNQMLYAMLVFGFLSLVTGIWLLTTALAGATQQTFLYFLGLGILSIVAAVTYTAGKKPYGYAGLGDLSVIIFFGWVGVLGTFYLYTQQFDTILLLPATSCGLFAAAVLNINNIRDIESDRKAGKKSVPVRLGRKKAVVYHWVLLAVGMLCAVAYVGLDFRNIYQFLFLISFPLLLRNGVAITQKEKPAEIDPYLKQMALTTLLFVLSFGIGQLLS
ncbi:MAG: 1,4-dihydroxy-2-naphthoate polyprenyltransferase [Bacteroidota bacterium]